MAAPFSKERVHLSLPEKRVYALTEERCSALVGHEVIIERLNGVKLVDAAFDQRLGRLRVEFISTGGVRLDVAAAATDVELLRVAGCTAATCLAVGRYPATRTSVGMVVGMRG